MLNFAIDLCRDDSELYSLSFERDMALARIKILEDKLEKLSTPTMGDIGKIDFTAIPSNDPISYLTGYIEAMGNKVAKESNGEYSKGYDFGICVKHNSIPTPKWWSDIKELS